MIRLTRLGNGAVPFLLNPDLITTVEATPDTVVTLTTGQRLVVVEPPEVVVAKTRSWRVGVMADALAQAQPDRTSR
jgi:flagellar protein FlbD